MTQALLDSLPPDLAEMARAAAIPHWFDAGILAALRPELAERAEQLYADLQRLPFVEPFAGRGHNVHELTRRLMLAHWWTEQRDEYVALSRRAANYFDSLIRQAAELLKAQIEELQRTESDEQLRAKKLQAWAGQNQDSLKPLSPNVQIEHIYHLLIADPEHGADAVWNQGVNWNNTFDYASVSALARVVREHADTGHATGRGRGWGRFFEGVMASLRSENPQARDALTEALASSSGDKPLEANCIRALGDVHV
ncbi:MAG: hypothetical protein ABI874_13835, partial [Chloroflexota bacterium]